MANAEQVYKEFIERYRCSPENNGAGPGLFVREVLGVQPDPWQDEVLSAYGAGERRISVASCHGVGKTTVASWIMVHQLLTKFPQKCVCTAPTQGQLFDALFNEVKIWIGRLPDWLQQLFEVKAERVELKAAPNDSFITARTSRAEQPEALAGVHSANVILVADEASGIPEAIYEAAAGSMSGGVAGESALTLLIGNPVRGQGFFYDTHHKLKDMWRTIQVAFSDSTRVSADFVEDMRRRYGERSNAYRVRVLGLFPEGEDDTVISKELVEWAVGRDVKANPKAVTVWGLDVARFGGDRNALAKRKANVQLEPVKVWMNTDLMETARKVHEEYNFTPPSERPTEILVDAIGIGAGVCDRLRQLGLPARAINVSESASAEEQYARLRDELWFKSKEWLQKLDCYLHPADKDLIAELSVPTFGYLPNGKRKVEGKQEMKKRKALEGGRSPDVADAWNLTFAGTAATMGYGTQAGGVAWNQPLTRGIKGIV